MKNSISLVANRGQRVIPLNLKIQKQNRSGLGGLKSIGKQRHPETSQKKNKAPVNIFDTPRISEGPIGILDSKQKQRVRGKKIIFLNRR